jgi:HAD superfamily hydrolase (TIGR01509 family)
VTTAVWFDCDGTLVDLDRPYPQLLEETFEARLGRSSNDLVDRYTERFLRALSEAEPEPYLRGMEAALEPVDDAPAPARLVAELTEREVAATTAVDGAARVLAALSERPVGVLTNGAADLQRAKLEACDLADHVDVVIASAEVGAVKPDPEMFAAARNRLAADAHVMIGDDREGDVAGAREAGFEAIHLDHAVDVGTVPSLATVAALLE